MSEGRSVVFEDLVNFVVQEARVATNPVFGSYVEKTDARQNNSGSVGKFRTKPLVAATHLGTGINYCIYCEAQGHELADCGKFTILPYEDRTAIVRGSALCYACLKGGHRSSDCRRRASCSVCGGRHPTSLHVDKSEENREQVNSVTNAASFTTKTQVEVPLKPALPIVPVVIHHGFKRTFTLAFLDSGSTHSFISKGLIQKLRLENMPQTRLSLTTVDREVQLTTQIVSGTWLTDKNSGNILDLPQLFSLDKIPVDSADFPTQAEVNKWKHLKGVKLELCKNSEVGLLLGSNAFLAMEPLEVVSSSGTGNPFAVRTRYGWVISGLRGFSTSTPAKCCKTLAHFDMQHLEKLVQQKISDEARDTPEKKKRVSLKKRVCTVSDQKMEVSLRPQGASSAELNRYISSSKDSQEPSSDVKALAASQEQSASLSSAEAAQSSPPSSSNGERMLEDGSHYPAPQYRYPFTKYPPPGPGPGGPAALPWPLGLVEAISNHQTVWFDQRLPSQQEQ